MITNQLIVFAKPALQTKDLTELQAVAITKSSNQNSLLPNKTECILPPMEAVKLIVRFILGLVGIMFFILAFQVTVFRMFTTPGDDPRIDQQRKKQLADSGAPWNDFAIAGGCFLLVILLSHTDKIPRIIGSVLAAPSDIKRRKKEATDPKDLRKHL